jgi:hypothetical protein
MPTPTTAKLFKPKSEDEFEDIAVDFLRLRWKDPHATRNGRRGQRQHGADVVGQPSWLGGRTAGAQCKNTEAVTLNMVIAETREAATFPGGLAEFLLVTSADRDAALQAAVRDHFRVHPAPFHVEMIFWGDITADLAVDDALIEKHWKGAALASSRSAAVSPTNPNIRGQLAVIQAEARRMKQHAEHLNAGFHHGFWKQYASLKFRPARLESVHNDVLAAVVDRPLLISSLDQLIATAGAADRETERFLDGNASVLRDLLQLLLNLMGHAHQVDTQIDQLQQTAPALTP